MFQENGVLSRSGRPRADPELRDIWGLLRVFRFDVHFRIAPGGHFGSLELIPELILDSILELFLALILKLIQK